MKKFIYVLVLISGVLFSGCENGETNFNPKIWDFINWDVGFVVRNDAGDNLMDPAVAGNWLDRYIYVEYRGEVYPINADTEFDTRANKPIWQGLRTETDDRSGIVLKFGEFSPEGDWDTGDDFKGETFTIHWGDGTSNKVKFDLYITWSNGDPIVHKSLWLNGDPRDADRFLIEIVK